MNSSLEQCVVEDLNPLKTSLCILVHKQRFPGTTETVALERLKTSKLEPTKLYIIKKIIYYENKYSNMFIFLK